MPNRTVLGETHNRRYRDRGRAVDDAFPIDRRVDLYLATSDLAAEARTIIRHQIRMLVPKDDATRHDMRLAAAIAAQLDADACHRTPGLLPEVAVEYVRAHGNDRLIEFLRRMSRYTALPNADAGQWVDVVIAAWWQRVGDVMTGK